MTKNEAKIRMIGLETEPGVPNEHVLAEMRRCQILLDGFRTIEVVHRTYYHQNKNEELPW